MFIFPIVFAVVYMTSVAGILYAGLICHKGRCRNEEEENKEEDSEYED